MKKTEAAYLAGIVDGEGSISMTRVGGKRRHAYWRIVLVVSNCDRELIEWLEQWGGATMYDMNRGPNKRPQHRWTIVGNALREMLPKIQPFLIIKAERAGWARRVLAIQNTRTGNKRPPEVVAELNEIRALFDNDRKRSLSARNREAYIS